MKQLLLVGGLAAGIILFIYEFYNNRNNNHQHAYRHDGLGGDGNTSDEEYIEINSTTAPDEIRRRLGPSRKPPGPDEVCSICLDRLIRRDADRRYCIIALPECGHWFHQKCAIRLLEYHPMCPVCRASIDGSRLRNTPVRVLQGSESDAAAAANTTTSTSVVRNRQ